MNVTKLKAEDIQWADLVFISAMSVQKESAEEVIRLCKKLNAVIVAGGPMFSASFEDYKEVDYLILNEAEITLPQFLKDFQAGHPKKIYTTDSYPDITETPVPDYHLLTMKHYASMNIQFSRGCPFACDFCEITTLFGHKVRTKGTYQILNELNALYEQGWKGQIFFVDDNFIGNKRILKTELLPALKRWMQEHKYPFRFNTEASINLSDDQELMNMMAECGFTSVFVGIESPDEKSLEECNKVQNKNRNLLQSIKKIQLAGLQVTAGFIVGFDTDSPTTFRKHVEFIQQSGIVSALVGLLNAPKNTKLHQRLKNENRLINDFSGNTDSIINFIPKMNYQDLLHGYKTILQEIYSIKPYYKRIRKALSDYNPNVHWEIKKFNHILAFLKSIFILGIFMKGRRYYWNLVFWCLFRHPGVFSTAITYTIYGYHYRKIYGIR